jgi:chemotaxis protein MotB
MPTFDKIKDQVKMTVTSEGLRIDLMETKSGMFFETGNPKPTSDGAGLLTALAEELAKLPNKVAIEGHTDSSPYGRADYSNWELSTDRANAARRIMQEAGLRQDQVNQVRGFADQRLLNRSDPLNPKNRRISIIVRSQEIDAQEEAAQRLQEAKEKAAQAHPAGAAGAPAAKHP